MTNVSKDLLDQKMQEKLFTQLADLFTAADKNTTRQFFSELLTSTERIMLMKRLAAIILLNRKFSIYRTAKTLHLSQTTVALLQEKVDQGMFQSIVKVTHKKEFDSKKFWMTMEVLLRGGLPPMGKHRWQSLDKYI